MRDACLNAVNSEMQRAYGRDATPAEIREIETAIPRHMRLLAREDGRAWAGKSEEERYSEAGSAAAEETIAEAKRKVANLAMRIIRMDALNNFLETQVATGRDRTRTEAFSRILAPRADLGGTPVGGSVDQIAQGIYGDAVARLVDVFEAGKRRGIWRIIPFNEPTVDRSLRRALAGETDGIPPEFVKMAKDVHEYVELLRTRFNAAGGNIGRLEDWGEPHHWSDHLIMRAINRRGRDAVVDDFTQAANRSKYLREDGAPMSVEEVRNFMSEALTTIVTEGANKALKEGAAPNTSGRSSIANRHRAHREIHLRSDATEKMLNTYSELGAMESLLVHMRALARDVSMTETFGPNADLTAQQLMRRSYEEDMVAVGKDSTVAKVDLKTKNLMNEYLYDHLAGKTTGIRSRLGQTISFFRSWATFKSLGFTVWSSLTDPVIMQHVAAARGLDAARLWVNDVKLFTNNGRRWAKRAGLITDTIVDHANRVNLDTVGAPQLGARAASFTLRVTGLNWVTEARRGAYGLTMMDTIGHLVRHNESLSGLKATDDREFLNLLNVNENTWALWRMAKLESLGDNRTVLSPQSIYAIPDGEVAARFPGEDPQIVKQRAATQLLGIVKDEINTAVTTAGTRERAVLSANTAAGTAAGEIIRSIMLFKSFPWTFLTRQGEVMNTRSAQSGARLPDWLHRIPGTDIPTGLGWLTPNRASYAASLIISTWVMGILINWIYDIFHGRDPGAIDMSTEGRRNIQAGLLRGGGMGFFGDFLFANSNPSGRAQSFASGLMGPIPQLVDDTQQLTLGNINQSASGEESNFGPEAISYAQRNLTPNWWFTQAVLDRYVFQQLQEEAQPGYNARRERDAQRTRGQTYYWEPATAEPDRLPDWRKAFEGDMPPPHHRRH